MSTLRLSFHRTSFMFVRCRPGEVLALLCGSVVSLVVKKFSLGTCTCVVPESFILVSCLFQQKEKDNKLKHSHHFVAVSFSNATTCNVCHKSMANKAALRCESE